MKKKLVAIVAGMIIGLTACSTDGTKDTSMTQNIQETNKKSIQEQSEETTKTVSSTIQWMNGTYGIITKMNNGDLDLVGGFDSNNILDVAFLKKLLESSWDITTKEEADEAIIRLIDEGGNNKDLLEEYAYYGLGEYTREELVEAISEEPKEDQAYFLGIYDAVQEYGDQAITAWDLSRAMQLLSWYYVAGLYSYEETMDKSLEVANKLQATYPSWDDMMKSYFYGFQYWNEDDPEDSTSQSYIRRKLYEELKGQGESPYLLDWNMNLVKEW